MVLHHGLFLLSTGTPILSETLCSQSLLASIPHSLSGSHLAAANYPSLCVLSLLLSMSLCMPVYVEREDLDRQRCKKPWSRLRPYDPLHPRKYVMAQWSRVNDRRLRSSPNTTQYASSLCLSTSCDATAFKVQTQCRLFTAHS